MERAVVQLRRFSDGRAQVLEPKLLPTMLSASGQLIRGWPEE